MNRLIALLPLALLIGCAKSQPADPIPPHDELRIASQALGETRVINVWTPPGYAEGDQALPVLYMPDGGIGEDFPHIAGTVAKLIEAKTIAPLILVGIENTERRRDLTGPSAVEADAKIAPVDDGSSVFRAFIADELMPEIDRRYRTTGQRAIVGESAAGLFIVETLLLRPELFDVYIAMDPALYWNDHDLVRAAPEKLADLPARPLRLWFAASDAPDIYPYNDQLAQVLKAHAPQDLTWHYERCEGETHRTIFRATKERALTWALWR